VPAIKPERIWVDAGHALLDGLGAQAHGISPAAELADMLEAMHPRRSPTLERALTRARDGAYFSAGQFGAELGRVEASPRRHWWQRA
jgi:hypothetical protein